MNVEPLRKTTSDGTRYARPEGVEDLIRLTLNWTFEELLKRAQINDRQDPHYVPSEVLMYHLRSTKHDNSDARFEPLYTIVVARIESSCPRAIHRIESQVAEDGRAADLRDAVVEHVVDFILLDRAEYNEQLDFFEVRFDRAIRLLRIDKRRRASRREDPKTALQYDDDTGDVQHEVEEALQRLKLGAWSEEQELTYRIQVRRAIDALPENERKVIDMLLAGIPIESKDPHEPAIVNILGCTEKTVRNRRDRAILQLRTELGLEVNDGQ